MKAHLQTFEPLVQKLFATMELTEVQQDELIAPPTKLLEDPGIFAVIDFFKQAQKIIVCGDYDCDGISSTSIAVLMARSLGIDVGYYIPNRLKDGYGVSNQTIEMASQRGYTDVLIIDNGVKAHEQIALANRLGMNVAVVDHHIQDGPLPVKAFLHPEVCGDYAHSMCASGLIYAVAETMGIATDYMLALAALATIGDVMPLWGKNREIVRRGTEVLNKNQFKQFDLIVKRNRYTNYSAKTLAFQVVPKVNSVGRMGDVANVNTTVSFFTSQDEGEIASYATQLLKLNDYRKSEGKKLEALAATMINDDPVQIIAHNDFHEGLLGIVANQVAGKTLKPTLVLTEYEDTLKGSGRSMTYSLQSIFKHINPDYFVAMGGHDFAYGMTLKKEYFEAFKQDINALVADFEPFESSQDGIVLIEPHEYTLDALHQLMSFEPYGEGFQLPLVKFALPEHFGLVNLNGYGYKFTFTGFDFDEAVFFSKQYERAALQAATSVTGSLDLSNPRKKSLLIEEIA
ncbi:recombinase RecJ [Erysipelothrix sp. HDW6C]|uniref:single-stranded-DNA-specific exonuclease RecJ n=1 Tax=Erysipelothrix sp. HDW6C TaxID=2714930 RepID=UPI00140BD054|nr:DHH family phosphoesterase [Erysipelothrix sp. HDW6C]QIK70368.1 recombinase RecJ [Erysipelothrix sp. HDW6C]